jgi:hypothetical protein
MNIFSRIHQGAWKYLHWIKQADGGHKQWLFLLWRKGFVLHGRGTTDFCRWSIWDWNTCSSHCRIWGSHSGHCEEVCVPQGVYTM